MLKFFSTTKIKPREFNYRPRYYDADKEELERRMKGKKLANDKGEMTKSRLRKEFGNYKSAEVKHKAGGFLGSSTFRLLVIIIILSMASYVILDNWLPKLMDQWFPEQTEEYELLEEYQ